jgi:hypothetical protein
MGRILEIEEREYGGDHGSRQLVVASRSARTGFEFSSLMRQITGKATARDQDWRSSFR